MRWEQSRLAEAAGVSLPIVRRLEKRPGLVPGHVSTVHRIKRALEAAGVVFIDGDGGGPGVRLREKLEG